jgi:hypothetical protein
VAFEREIDLLDAVPLGACAEGGFRPWCAATEENAVRSIHARDDSIRG